MRGKFFIFCGAVITAIIGAAKSQQDPVYNPVWVIGLLLAAILLVSFVLARASLKAEVAPKLKLKGFATRDPSFTDEITAVIDYKVELPYNPKVDFWNDPVLQQAILDARMDWRKVREIATTRDVFETPSYDWEEDSEKVGEKPEEKPPKKSGIRPVPKPSNDFMDYGRFRREDFKNDGEEMEPTGSQPTPEERRKRADDIVKELSKLKKMLEDEDVDWFTMRSALVRIREMVGPLMDKSRNRWTYIGLWRPWEYSDGRGGFYEMIIAHRESFEAEFPQVDMIDDKIIPPFPMIISASPVWLVKYLDVQPDLPLYVPMITFKDAIKCIGEVSNQVNVINDAIDVYKRYCGYLRTQQMPDAMTMISLQQENAILRARSEREHNRNIELTEQLYEKEDTDPENQQPQPPQIINTGKIPMLLAGISTIGLVVSLIFQFIGR